MKKIVSALSLTSYLALAQSAFAANTLCPAGNSDFNGLCNVGISGIIGPLINLIFIIAIIAALIYLVYGGFKWLTSGGDKAAVAGAREHIIAAIVGLVIIFLSYFILQIVIGFFVPGFHFSNFSLPTIIGG